MDVYIGSASSCSQLYILSNNLELVFIENPDGEGNKKKIK